MKNNMDRVGYSVGFIFDPLMENVLLMSKVGGPFPGKLNGVGGRVHFEQETATLGMFRELKEDQIVGKGINLHVKSYWLHNIPGTDWYIQKFDTGKTKFKSLPALFYPFVIRAYLKQEVTEDDKVFFHEGQLAKFVTTPTIKVV